MKKKFLSMVTALVMLISLLPQGIITVSAATITATPPSTDENGVYQIGTAAELYWFAAQVNGGTTDINAVLTDNIVVNTGVLTDEGNLNSSNMDNFTSWTPIGNSSKQYTGTFDGNGKTISGLYVNNTNAYYVGLFGYVGSDGRVSNVGVVGSYFRGSDYIGGVCGENYGTIENCYNAGSLTSTTTSYIGGVCGENNGTIENCYNAGTVYNFFSRAYSVCGNNRKIIKNCYYLDTTGTDSYATPKTAEEFASGEVAYLLQSGQEADENGNIPEVWGQDLSTANTYPVPGGTKVYQVVAYAGCENNPGNEGTAYSNTDAPVYGDHSFDSNGFGVCGDSLYQPAKWDETNNRCEISNAGQLYWFAGLVNGTLEGVTRNLSANAVLTKDIVVNTGVLKSDGTLADDTSDFTSWTPIGNSDHNYYTGTFDGNGKTVSGLYFNGINAYNVGLFGYVGSNETNKGSVSNVGVVDSYFNGEVCVGGVCGANYGTITNSYSTAEVSGNENVGGVCGENYGTIENCYNIGAVSGKNLVGGVCGANSGTIAVCYNKGTVMGKNRIGGVCGHNFANNTIANCYKEGVVTVTGDSAHAGGVCGANEGTIENCYNTAEVDGNDYVGGVCGENYGATTDCYNTGTVSGDYYVGGVCGANYGTTTDCYNTAEVSGDENVGGVCGENNGTTTDCYNIGTVSGNEKVGGVCGANSGTIAVCCNKGTVMGENRVGGVCGQNFANTTIANCYNAGGVTVTGDSAYAGGLCGFTADQSTITNCYNAGSITVTGDSAYVGGLCGYASINSTIKNCYNAGSITVTGNSACAGGVCGHNSNGNITNCYFDSEKYSGNAVAQNDDGTVTNVEGKTTDKFTSGEVAYLLQSGQKADENGNTPEVWGQEIGTDIYPVPGGAKVYQVVAYAGCEKNPGNEGTAYSNTNAPVYGDHTFDSNGFCVCGDSLYQPAKWDETNNRYEISNAGQLYWFAGLVNGTLSGVTQNTSANAILTDNIVVNTGVLKADGTLADDTSSFTSWTPIGNSSKQYTGTFNGNGKTISGLYFNDTNAYNVGLFGCVGSNETNKGSVSNVGVVDSYFGGHMEVGGVCGTAGDNSTITNCYNTGTVKGTIYGGGVCGTAGANSTIENCYNTGKVSGKSNVGGVCGSAGGNSTIKNCYNKGLVDGNDNGGGVCGENYGTIEVCYNTGSVIGIGKTGGVCGTAGANSTIANCYNAGSIASSLYAGGVCGTAGANSTITNCYNAGSVAASGNSASAGGVCGRNSNGNITNCYFDSEKYSGNAVANDENGTVTNVEGKTTDKFTSGEVAYLLQGKQTENVWGQEIDTDNYPVLTSDLAKKVCKVEFDTRNADGEYTLYTERYENYGKVLSDFPEELTDTIWVGGGHQFTASSTVTEDKTVYSVGYSVKYDDDGKVVISAPKMGNYTIIIASYSGESLLRAKSADIQINSWYEAYEITALCGFDTTGADTVKVFFWDTEMRPQCNAAVKTLL